MVASMNDITLVDVRRLVRWIVGNGMLLSCTACAFGTCNTELPVDPECVNTLTRLKSSTDDGIAAVRTTALVDAYFTGGCGRDEPLAWSVDDESIATITSTTVASEEDIFHRYDAPGGHAFVLGRKPGTVHVSARTVETARVIQAAVTFGPGPIATVKILPDTATIRIGQIIRLTADVRDADGNPIVPSAMPSWSSSELFGVVYFVTDRGPTIDVSGVAPGLATVAVNAGGITGTAQVRVIPASNTIVVSPSSKTLKPGQTVTLNATVTDPAGNPAPATAVGWTSENNSIASIPAGAVGPSVVVTAVAAGGPVKVTATLGDVSASSQITIESGAARIAYALADQPGTGSYRPSAANAFSSTGGAINVTRSDSGMYRVTFDGQQTPSTGKTSLFVTSVGTDLEMCRVASFSDLSSSLVADVRCTDSDGDPSDQAFSILLAGDNLLPKRFAFALADQPSPSASYTPNAATAFSSTGQPITVARRGTGAGAYSVTLTGQDRTAATDREAVLVSAVGTGSERCGTDVLVGSTVNVQCVQSGTDANPSLNGRGIDSKFTVGLFNGDGTHVVGIARAVLDASKAYTALSTGSFNAGGGAVTVVRDSMGVTHVTFSNLASATTPAVNVQLSATDGSGQCKLVGWKRSGLDFVASATCFDNAELPADIPYTLLVIR
jgi:Bacterial Ig-like domain (group 2)